MSAHYLKPLSRLAKCDSDVEDKRNNMKKVKIAIKNLLLGIGAVALTASARPSVGLTMPISNMPVKIIFDTDMETDCDDIAALGILHAMADNGECEVLATISSGLNPWSAPTIDAINTYYGRPNVLIGNVKGEGVSKSSRYAEKVAVNFKHELKSGNEAPDALSIYRQVLENQPNGSVTIVTVGYLTNLANLILEEASKDHLSGLDLVRQKVKLWVCMGGNFIGTPAQDNGKLGNHNFEYDAKAALDAVNNWPTPIVFAGREVCSVPSGLKIGENLAVTSSNNPVRAGYEYYFGGIAKNRHVADSASVMYAVRGARDYWDVSAPGTMLLNKDMTFKWVPSDDGQQKYLLKKTGDKTNDRYVETELDKLLIQPPKHVQL
jgi:inosine-uridine nucleoside N-ribohydrolase